MSRRNILIAVGVVLLMGAVVGANFYFKKDKGLTVTTEVIKKRDLYEKAYRLVVQRGIEDGVFRKCDVKVAAWAILGALNWSVQWFSPKGKFTADELGRQFADLFLHALQLPSHCRRGL